MGRAWRIEFDGAFYHVMSRGNEGRNIFFDDNDRYGFLGVVGEISERFEIDIFAYVLMDNHYHLLIRTQQANLSKAMQWLGVTYTRRFNNKHSRIGELFGVSSSCISHIVWAMNLKLQKDRQAKDKLNQIYSLFKI